MTSVLSQTSLIDNNHSKSLCNLSKWLQYLITKVKKNTPKPKTIVYIRSADLLNSLHFEPLNFYLLWEHHSVAVAKTIAINVQFLEIMVYFSITIRSTSNHFRIFIIRFLFVYTKFKGIIIVTHLWWIIIDMIRMLLNEITNLRMIDMLYFWHGFHFVTNKISNN